MLVATYRGPYRNWSRFGSAPVLGLAHGLNAESLPQSAGWNTSDLVEPNA